MDWQGFSVEWYAKAFANPFAMKALWTSVTVGLWTAVLATTIGTLAALGLERMHGAARKIFDGLIYVAIMVPGVVIGIATLIAFVTVFDAGQSGAGRGCSARRRRNSRWACRRSSRRMCSSISPW